MAGLGPAIHEQPVRLCRLLVETLPESYEWLRRYVIRRDAKAKIRAQLSALGIRRSNLFPDLDNLALELKGARFA